MSKKSKQGCHLDRPDSYRERNIGLVLSCVKCGTQRTYQITAQLEDLRQRGTKMLGAECECSKCGNVIGAALVWFDNALGYSYRPTPKMNAMMVVDEQPLIEPLKEGEI